MKKNIEDKYKSLSERDHILQRSGMWIGSNKLEISNQFVFDYKEQMMIQKEVEYVPAILKLIDEIISNSTDEFRRSDNLGLTQINVTIMKDDTIIIEDNGGIPVVNNRGKSFESSPFDNDFMD